MFIELTMSYFLELCICQGKFISEFQQLLIDLVPEVKKKVPKN